ncbi:NTP transferase domain-containing protein [Gramella sp. AN32]|uniref:Probable molybdenum cofactor guanylyltransferase n=1 Tax=Christiangramia antarctica TaxID=2058158 RepID=A0ABW5X6A5_9FLAO|nr:NTP transferase domain-containing protein [Gramella sp. AN32]MCM4156210.1 molybdenum cofactor guanylyltransferase [Gramella sp. AN32]
MKTKIFGLILAGGKSTRMGKDKGNIAYHSQPHREHLYNLLKEVCEEVFMSIREEQTKELAQNFKSIIDTNEFRGPFNGLQSAHQKYPDVAWLVLATDLPLIDLKHIKKLIAERDPAKPATAFATRESGLPEPLCAIWEPHGLEKGKKYLENGINSCPRKFLINSDIKLVFPENDQVLINANSLQDLAEAQKIIAKS